MPDKAINFASLGIFTVALAIGQILFKHVGLAMRGHPLVEGMFLLARQPALYLALLIYGFSTVLWIWILSRVPLMQAYPWVGVGVALVPFLGWYFFGEKVTSTFWVGVAFILIGMLLTQYASEAL